MLEIPHIFLFNMTNPASDYTIEWVIFWMLLLCYQTSQTFIIVMDWILAQLNMSQTHFSADFWYLLPSLLPNHQNSKIGGMNKAVNLKSLLIVTWVLSLILSWPTFQVWIYWGLWPFGGWDFVLSLRFCNINLHLGKKSY